MDLDIPQYCRRCGTMLIDGICPTCPVHAPAPAPQPQPQPHRPAPATRTAVISAASAAPPAADKQPTQTEAHRAWFSSVPTPDDAKRGIRWRYAHMWNWGAFLLCPLWLMNHGRPVRALAFVALCVAPFLWVFALGMAIAYGIKGNTVASTSRNFVDDAQFADVQNAWRNAGFGVVLLALVLVLVVGYAATISVPR